MRLPGRHGPSSTSSGPRDGSPPLTPNEHSGDRGVLQSADTSARQSTQLCGPVFVLPVSLKRGTSPAAAWITTAGWASGADSRWGTSWILAPDGVITSEEARRRAADPSPQGSPRPWRRRLPRGAVTLAKDALAAGRGFRSRDRALAGPWREASVPFVWQRHALFEYSGLRLAEALGSPLVLSVHALQVREARSWGVPRKGWGSALERVGERPFLLAADLVAAVSEEVAEQVREQGVPHERIVVTPNEVDLDHFSFDPFGRERVRRCHGLDGFVVGWTGSFRSFHGLDVALRAVARLQRRRPDTSLLLVGDGIHRTRLEALSRELNLQRVVFTGTVPYERMPEYISAMDATLVLTANANTFHYSPVKLREYMGCSRPVVAHRVGELARTLRDSETALLTEPDDPVALATALLHLAEEPALGQSLGTASRQTVVARGGWGRPVALVAEALGLSQEQGR